MLGNDLGDRFPAERGVKKGHGPRCEPKAVKFAFITAYRGPLSKAHLCRLLEVSDRGLRAWRARSMSLRQRKDLVFLAHIREHHNVSMRSCGRPRMTEALREAGLEAGQRRVGRLMKDNGICVVRTRKHKVTTDSNHSLNVAPNLLEQDFTAATSNQKWASDISYIWTREGWLYLAVVLDLHSRRVARWAVSDRLKKGLAIRALQMAITLRKPPPGCSARSLGPVAFEASPIIATGAVNIALTTIRTFSRLTAPSRP